MLSLRPFDARVYAFSWSFNWEQKRDDANSCDKKLLVRLKSQTAVFYSVCLISYAMKECAARCEKEKGTFAIQTHLTNAFASQKKVWLIGNKKEKLDYFSEDALTKLYDKWKRTVDEGFAPSAS